MRQPWEWEEDDIVALISNRTQESIDLDYKECDALALTDSKKNEVSKDVSAFANSAGGTIVYGVIEDKHVPLRLDHGFDPNVISKEWLEQVISFRIKRTIDGVRIKQIELSKSNPGKVVYVVYVPQSTRAPHQASDKKFYKRRNFASEPMEEYEIRDVANRSEVPDLWLQYSVTALTSESTNEGASDGAQSLPVRLRVEASVMNDAATPAEYAVIVLYIDSRLQIVQRWPGLYGGGTQQLECNGSLVAYTRLCMNHGIPGMMPIFQGAAFKLSDRPLLLDAPSIGAFTLLWHLQAPKMIPRVGGIVLNWHGQTLQAAATAVPIRVPTPGQLGDGLQIHHAQLTEFFNLEGGGKGG